MGHNRLGRLPRTRRWKQVVQLLENGAELQEIAQLSLKAVETSLERIPNDHGFTQTLTTIFNFIAGIQAKDPVATLRLKGFEVPDNASLLDYVGSFKTRADSELSSIRFKSDACEIAQNSFSQLIFEQVTPSLPTLFGTGPADAQSALQKTLRGEQLGKTFQGFFRIFTKRYLDYYLGRELPNQVGVGKSFSGIDSHREFNEAFDSYIRETIRITQDFTPGWYSKARYQNRITPGDVSRFAHIAFRKIREEFKRGAEEHG